MVKGDKKRKQILQKRISEWKSWEFWQRCCNYQKEKEQHYCKVSQQRIFEKNNLCGWLDIVANSKEI
jgi:hypothetical protein